MHVIYSVFTHGSSWQPFLRKFEHNAIDLVWMMRFAKQDTHVMNYQRLQIFNITHVVSFPSATASLVDTIFFSQGISMCDKSLSVLRLEGVRSRQRWSCSEITLKCASICCTSTISHLEFQEAMLIIILSLCIIFWSFFCFAIDLLMWLQWTMNAP